MKKIRPFYYAQMWKNIDFTRKKEKHKPFPTGTKTNKLVDTNYNCLLEFHLMKNIEKKTKNNDTERCNEKMNKVEQRSARLCLENHFYNLSDLT